MRTALANDVDMSEARAVSLAYHVQLRWYAYCLTHGNTPAEQCEEDARAFPGGRASGFLHWMAARKQEFHAQYPEACYVTGTGQVNGIVNHDLWDRYLVGYANAHHRRRVGSPTPETH